MNRIEEKLLNPPPGSRIEAARAHGVDLTLLIEQLRKTPEERVLDLQRAAEGLEAMRGKARRSSGGVVPQQVPNEQRKRA